MISRFLLTALDLKMPVATLTVEKQGPFGVHEDQNRFKGTKVYFRSDNISPDYDIVAAIDHTSDNGKEIWLTWRDLNGVKYGPYLLKEGESIKIISIKDAQALKVTPAPQELVKLNERTREERKREEKTPIQRMYGFLRNNDIEAKLSGDRIFLVLGKYYLEHENGGFELCDARRGVIAIYQESKEGVKRLLKKIEKIENSIDYERELKKMAAL